MPWSKHTSTTMPTMSMNESWVSLDADLSALETLEELLSTFCRAHGLGKELLYHMNLVLEELVTNCIKYSLAGVDDPVLRVRLAIDGDCVEARVEDNGPEFDPFKDAPEADTISNLPDRPIGGLGVFLIKTLVERHTYERVDGMNRVSLLCPIERGDSDD